MVYRVLQREQFAERVGGVVVDLVNAGGSAFISCTTCGGASDSHSSKVSDSWRTRHPV